MIGRWIGALACGAMLAAGAQAACWNSDEVAAATVRELQSKLMVAALRCRVSGFAMMDDYNGFVAANRDAIGRMNDRLKAHFIRAAGPVAGQRGYDAFTTSMANGYGAAVSDGNACAAAAALAREGAMMAGSAEGLLVLADREGLVAKLPEGTCRTMEPITLASAGPLTSTAR